MLAIVHDPRFLKRLWLVMDAAVLPDQAATLATPEKQQAIRNLEEAMRRTGVEPEPDHDCVIGWLWDPITAEYRSFWDTLTDEERAVQVAEAELRLQANTSSTQDGLVEACADLYRTKGWENWEIDRSWMVGLMPPEVEAVLTHGIREKAAWEAVREYALERTLAGEFWICGACGAYVVAEKAPRPESGVCHQCTA